MERRKPIVGGVKFSAHVAMKRMESVPDEHKKHPGNSEVLS